MEVDIEDRLLPTTGLCGNFDGDPNNDLVDEDGNDLSGNTARYKIFSEPFKVEST